MPIISECTFTDFDLLRSSEVVADNSTIGLASECSFKLPVFAYLSDTTDTYRNDFTSSLLTLTNRYSTPKFYLEKETSCDVWENIAELTSANTYGIYYSEAALQTDWRGYKVLWHKVYSANGIGCYRIKQTYVDITDGNTDVKYSYKYDLKLFTSALANKTTKLTYTIDGGKIGSTLDDENVIDYGSVIWSREIRLPQSFFGFESSEYTREYTRYKNGGEVWTQDEQNESILFYVKQLPYSLHRELKITALQSGKLFISDYNTGNPKKDMYNMKRVNPSSGYEPTWSTNVSYAPVELTFEPYYKNLRRKRC